VLVEGLTEKLVLPFVFSALGYDVDREAISIVECGGKPNIPLFARICRAVGFRSSSSTTATGARAAGSLPPRAR
jgi:predicted ATP-dependent endonuclease of OLD family